MNLHLTAVVVFLHHRFLIILGILLVAVYSFARHSVLLFIIADRA